MNLTVPVNSMESCISQINAGADEIFLAYKVDCFKRMSFSARPQFKNGNYIVPDKKEFSEIVKYAKKKHVKVLLAANTAYFSDYLIAEFDIEKEFIEYVKYGVECGIDAVILADVGLVYLVNNLNMDVEIYCSTLLDLDNVYELEFLKKLNVNRVVLSYQISLKELEILSRATDMQLEVFGYGGCSFSSNCMLGHSEKYGIPCENEYFTNRKSNSYKQICSAFNCSLCYVWDMINLVNAIKIQGRERNYKKVVPLTKMYRRAIDIANESSSKSEYLEKITREIPIWWKKCFCDCKQCKYDFNNNEKSIVNIGVNNICMK